MDIEVPLQEGEELAQLFDGRLRIIQKKEGYRFSLDAILLAHFTSLIKAHSIVDLGTGSGIIPLVLARKMDFPFYCGGGSPGRTGRYGQADGSP